MTKINTNIAALMASTYNLKARSESEAAATTVASGKRINSASDDAAGLAVSNKLKSQIGGMQTAFKNTADGISLLQAALAGMQTSLDISHRLRELAVQSHNGAYTDSDRQNLQDEMLSLQGELQRIAEATTFNNINLLDGSYEQLMRVGNTNAETVSISIDGMGVNRHIEGSSYATGSAISLLSPLEYAGGPSSYDTGLTAYASGDMAARYKASAATSGVSSFNIPASSNATGSSTLFTLPTSNATGTSVFDTPASSAASGASNLDYLATNTATGTSEFRTPETQTATGTSTLNVPANFSGVAEISGDTSALSRAFGASERVLKAATTASGASQLNRVTANQVTHATSYTSNGNSRVLSSGTSVSSGVLATSQASVASNGASNLQPLSFVNSDFSGGPVSRTVRNGEATQQINGWQVHLKQIALTSSAPASLQRTIAGFAAPADSNQPAGSVGDGSVITGFAGNDIELSYRLENGGITLGTNDVVAAANGIVHGPYVVSDSAVSLEIGDSISFNWQGVGSGDAADVRAFLIDENDGTVVDLVDYTHNAIGQTPVFSVNETITRQGSYKFAFISGSFDENGGGRVGSQISLTNLAITQNDPANAAVTNASVTLEATEANMVTIAASALAQMQTKVAEDTGVGVYSMVARGADFNKFSIDQNGVITSTQPLMRATQTSYNFDVKYVGTNGKTHIETVTLNLQTGLGASSDFTAQEADSLTIARSEMTLLDSFYNSATGGNFSIGTGADGAQFRVDSNGQVSSVGALNYEDGAVRNFDVIYTATDGRVFTNQVRLALLDTLESSASFTAEESDQITISAAAITSSASIAAADGNAGSFSLGGTDAGYFSLDGGGNIISNGTLRLADKQSYDLKYIYTSPNFAPTHIENIQLNLTEALQASSVLYANSADDVRIDRAQLGNLFEFAARDSHAGSYNLGPSGSDADDYLMFQIDSSGNITSQSPFDPALQSQFSFIASYTNSAGDVFSETVTLNLSSPSAPVTTIRATETQALAIAASEFQYTQAAATAVSGGTYNLRGTDNGLFTIDGSGNITANQALLANHSATYNPDRNFEFIIDYTAGGVLQSNETVRLQLSESLNANAVFTSQESTQQISIDAEDLTAVNAFALRDRKAGSYSVSSSGGDHLSFTVDANGRVTSNAGLEFDAQQSYSFNVEYQSSDGRVFSEAVTLNLTDTFQSFATITAEETQSLTIDNTTLTSSFAFYSKDPGVGSFQLTGTDASAFTIDNFGNVTSNGALLRSAKENYSFNVVYTATNNDVHSEAVNLALSEALQANTTLNAVESGQVNILLDRLTHLSGFASRDGSRGTFSIEASGSDFSKFTIAANGNITSVGALDFDTQQSYNFNVIYQATNGLQFRDAITLNLADTLNSTAQMTAEESTNIVIAGTTLAATNTFAGKDTGVGSYALSGTDASYFTLVGNEVRSNQPLVHQTKDSYNFNVEYTSSTGDLHTESINLQLTPSLQADSVLTAPEANRVNISLDDLTHLTNFAVADGYGGSFRLERYDNADGNPANDGDADDVNEFTVDQATRMISSFNALDYSVEDVFHFNVVYRASDGREFTDRVVLSLEDTLASSAVLEVEEADQMVINIADLTASNSYAGLNPGGSYSIGTGSNLFQVVGGQVIANKVFRKEEQPSYNFELIYTHGATQHVEDVTVNLTRFMQSEGTFTALEASTVFLNGNEFTYLDDYARDNPGGMYQLSGADAGLFGVNNTGAIYSLNALDYDSQQSYRLNLDYVLGSDTFSSEITLNLEDTLSAQATLSVEEAQSVIVQGSLLTSLQAYAAKDGNQGAFELLEQGDYDKFTMASDGTLTSKGELRMADDPVLDLYIRYNSASIDNFVEHVQINLTPTSYDHSRSEFVATESSEVIIVPQINTFLAAYAEADNYAGSFELAQSPYTTVRDHLQFEIDNTGQISSTGRIDFESGRTEFEVTVYYNHSSGTKRYTDFRRLDITNDKRDDNNLALEGIDISTREGAADAAELLNEVIVGISAAQAKLGAIENRFTHNIDNLSMNILMSEQANGRIVDADYAAESTRLARSQILEQAATNMLVNANQAKQNLLMLIN